MVQPTNPAQPPATPAPEGGTTVPTEPPAPAPAAAPPAVAAPAAEPEPASGAEGQQQSLPGVEGEDVDGDNLTFTEVLTDPGFAAEHKARTDRAVETALKKERADAKKAADRAGMEEADRIKAEKADAERERDEMKLKLEASESDRAYQDAVIASGHQLADADAAKFLRMKVNEIRAAKDTPWEAAIEEALKTSSYLVKPAPAPAPPAETAPPTTVPTSETPDSGTQTPATPTPSEGVDVLKMSPQEYQLHKQKTHGIH